MGLVVRISKKTSSTKCLGTCVVEGLLAHTSLFEGCLVERLRLAWLCAFLKTSCEKCPGEGVVKALLLHTSLLEGCLVERLCCA